MDRWQLSWDEQQALIDEMEEYRVCAATFERSE
jgi:hypothetical protein